MLNLPALSLPISILPMIQNGLLRNFRRPTPPWYLERHPDDQSLHCSREERRNEIVNNDFICVVLLVFPPLLNGISSNESEKFLCWHSWKSAKLCCRALLRLSSVSSSREVKLDEKWDGNYFHRWLECVIGREIEEGEEKLEWTEKNISTSGSRVELLPGHQISDCSSFQRIMTC